MRWSLREVWWAVVVVRVYWGGRMCCAWDWAAACGWRAGTAVGVQAGCCNLQHLAGVKVLAEQCWVVVQRR